MARDAWASRCAEFGHGYGQTQEDMLWWIKRAAIAGCNAQVFHGASYCGDGVKGVGWPGWEAWNRFCSNNWNRTLSERSLSIRPMRPASNSTRHTASATDGAGSAQR